MTCTGLLRWRMLSFCGVLVILAGVMTRVNQTVSAANEFDVVIAGGRVMDPESGLDGVRNVGITGGRIAAISATPLQGRTTIEAGSLVVSPGVIKRRADGRDPRE